MQRRSWEILTLAMISSQTLAMSPHGSSKAGSLVRFASSTSDFDHVPSGAEQIAAIYGVVTSTFRTVAHNREVGGVEDSYHLLGRAIDVARRRGISHAQIAAALRAAGYPLIESLDEGDHSHFAFGPALRRSPAPKSSALLGPRIAADRHGVLLSDLDAAAESHASSGPLLRIHIRTRR